MLLVCHATKVAIPAVSEDGVVTKWSELDGGSTSHHSSSGSSNSSKAIERVKNRDYDGSLYMVNKPPRWNDQVLSSYVFRRSRISHVQHRKVWENEM